MNLDFPAILVLATFVTGLIWAIDAILFAPARRERIAVANANADLDDASRSKISKEPWLVEIARSFFPVILIVLLLRSFLVEPFRIPSGSMMPTLVAGDFILVNKFSYGIRLPVLNKKIFSLGEPERGDVVVFRYPEDPRIDFIKRVVGLPGDHIRYRNKVVYVNGVEMPQQALGEYVGAVSPYPNIRSAALLEEDLEGHEHDILINRGQPSGGMYAVNGDYTVPAGHYFVMGDNRDNSKDSRFWGPMPEENLVGKAFMIWMNWGAGDGWIGWDRIGESIQ